MSVEEVRLAVVGTAGRGDDGTKISKDVYNEMIRAAAKHVRDLAEIHERPVTLVSGGAAYADHLAVHLFANGLPHVEGLQLYLPADFVDGSYVEDPTSKFDPGRTANRYHRQFAERIGQDSLGMLSDALDSPKARWRVVPGGFKTRNTQVAKDSNFLVAFTFGPGREIGHFSRDSNAFGSSEEAGLKDGGTADTWRKCRDALVKTHVPIDVLALRAELRAQGWESERIWQVEATDDDPRADRTAREDPLGFF